MNYDEAARTRRTGLLSLIAEKKFQDGKSLGSSIGGAISDKFKAKAVGFKEKFDPLNMIRGVVGKGVIGKSLITIAGRAMGKDEDDIRHFGGYGSRKRKLNETLSRKDPLISTIGAGAVVNIRPGDGAANIMAKTYNFMEKTHETYKRNYELDELFRKEQYDEDERRHKKLIDAILNRKEPEKEKEKDDSDSFIQKLLKFLSSMAKGILSSIFKMLPGILLSMLGVVEELIKKVAGEIFKLITKFFQFTFDKVFRSIAAVQNGLAQVVESLGPLLEFSPVGKASKAFKLFKALTAGATIASLLEKEEGEEDESVRDARILLGDKAVDLYKAAQPLADELKFFMRGPEEKAKVQKKYDDLIEKADEERKKYQQETVFPITEKLEYKPSGKVYSTPFTGVDLPAFEDKQGKNIPLESLVPKIEGAKSDPNILKMATGDMLLPNKLPLREEFESELSNLRKSFVADDDVETNLDTNKVKLEPDASVEVKSIPPLIETDANGIASNDQVVSVVNTQNNIGGGAPKMVDTGTTALRNNEIYNSVYAV
jgi:hypothetical protein